MVQPRGLAHGVMEDWSEALSVTTTPIDTVYLVHPPKIFNFVLSITKLSN